MDRPGYNRDDALLAAAQHLQEAIRHHREAAAIVTQFGLKIALPEETPLLTAFSDCHLQRRVPVKLPGPQAS